MESSHVSAEPHPTVEDGIATNAWNTSPIAVCCLLTKSALEELSNYFTGRCDDRRNEVESLQFDGKAGKIRSPQMLVA